MPRSPLTRRASLGLIAAALAAPPARAGEPLRLGLLQTLSPAPFYIAQEHGYFRDEGLELAFRFFSPPSRSPPQRLPGTSTWVSPR